MVRPASAPSPPGHDMLFVVRADQRLEPVTESRPITPEESDNVVLLTPVPSGQ